jgi:hypothetical protein
VTLKSAGSIASVAFNWALTANVMAANRHPDRRNITKEGDTLEDAGKRKILGARRSKEPDELLRKIWKVF